MNTMSTQIIPPSPNWYCSKVTDSNKSKTLVYGGRHDVYIFGYEQYPPVYLGVFIEHKEKVTALSLCDHKEYETFCCSGSEDGNVKLWNYENQVVKMQHTIHSHKVTGICWSKLQADLIISGDDNGTLGVWQLETNQQSAHRLDKSGILCLAVSPYSAGLVAVGLKIGQILLIDVKRGNYVLGCLKGHDEEVYSLAWCTIPGEQYKPVQPAQADITDLESFGVEESWRKPKASLPASSSSEEGFGSEGWLLASGSKDKTIRLWSTSRFRQLQVMKLPSPGRRERNDDGGRGRSWLSLCWLQQNPRKIISSSQSGDLIIWNISKTGKEKFETIHSTNRGHFRFVFNICPVWGDTKTICTISMDRQIIFWDVDLKQQIGVLSSVGGYVYTAKTSPFDPGRLALGVGDNMIRLWNLNSPTGVYDLTALWQGIRSKVTALCWHPVKEGLLAYGTDDGRIGIYNTLNNKPPMISTTYHRRTVYVVAWAPDIYTDQEESKSGGSTNYHVYSCGDGNILKHAPHALDKEAININRLISENNPSYRAGSRVPTRSEISWNPDFTAVAVGNDDGTVEVYSSETFKLMAVIQTHHKLVNVVLWHPSITMVSPNASPYKHYIAIASNEYHITVVDISSLFDAGRTTGEVLHITEAWRRLDGHNNRVTGLAWSPHTDGHLVSVSYDEKAVVWNVTDNVALACYQGHIGKLLCCQWNGLDPGEVITGGDDFSVHTWKIADHPVQPGQLDPKKRNKKKYAKSKAKLAAADDTSVAMETTSVTIDTTSDKVNVMTLEDQDEIEKLMEAKRRELQGQRAPDHTGDHSVDVRVDTTVGIGASENVTLLKDTVTLATKSAPSASSSGKKTEKYDGRRKFKGKSMFPELGRRENKGKQQLLNDVVILAKLIYGGKDAVDPEIDVTHLGLFLDRRATYALLALEADYHGNNENMDYFYQLEVWKGNINGALRVARQRDELSDWLVAMAPMASFDTWTSVCEDYAVQLEMDGQYHKAASYFLACQKVYEAIRLFKRHKLFKEAISLAKVRLSPVDPALEELYTLWAQQLTKDGNYEQAAKCHLAMKQVQDAAKLLARRYDQSSLRTAAHISMIGNDKQQGLMYTQRVIQQNLIQNEWSEAYSFLKSKKDLQVYMATSSIHEMLSCELTTLGILNLENSQFTKWHQKQSTKTHLPDFILDPGDVDTLSPWQLHLIEGHTFPHHILRTWYNHFDIAMDTTSIEDMYKTLCLLHAGRQAQVELPLILIQVCTDLSLCMLSLMMSETPTAMSHLLQAIGSLHEAGHLHVMQCLLRLFLPQGPKYILKLQQEVTAMRVMISMDTHAHVDGASKVHTIKRYLSEHKDESVINTSNLRCRELDCLRAYYYIAIINFLKESCFSGETADSATSSDKTDEYSSPDTQLSDVSDIDTKVELKLTPEKEMKVASERVRVSPGKDGSSMADVKVKAETGTKVENNNISDSMKESSNSTKIITPAAPAQSNACVVKVSSESEKKAQGSSSKSNPPDSINDKNKTSERNCDSSAKNQVQDQKADTKCDNKSESKGIADVLIGSGPRTGSPSSKSPSQSKESSPTTALSDSSTQTTRLMSEQTSIIPTNQKHSLRCQTIPVLNVNHYSITVARLSQLSQGLLWDLQAKRFALTETLGYIHKAISQLLLSKNSQSSDTLSGMDSESSEGQSGDKDGTGLEADGEGSSQGQTNRQTSSSGKTGDDGGLEARAKSKSRDRSSADGVSNGEKDGSGAAMATEKSMKKASQPGSSKSHKTADTYLCDHHHHNFGDHHHNFGEHAEGELCHSVLSYHFDQMLNIHVPHVGEVPVHMGETDTETDFKCSFFEVCSSCELLHKSRKILFDDEPRSHTRPEVPGIKDMTNITNPAKYINVPDEWYGMPVDQKYFKRYITMAILKDEQEYVMRELKRAPDNTQSPFPNPLESVVTLLDLAGHSSHVGTVARQEYVQKVITWALNFAVTTQQKQTFLNVLQTHLES